MHQLINLPKIGNDIFLRTAFVKEDAIPVQFQLIWPFSRENKQTNNHSQTSNKFPWNWNPYFWEWISFGPNFLDNYMYLFRLLRITITFMLTIREASSKFDIFRSPQRLRVGMFEWWSWVDNYRDQGSQKFIPRSVICSENNAFYVIYVILMWFHVTFQNTTQTLM